MRESILAKAARTTVRICLKPAPQPAFSVRDPAGMGKHCDAHVKRKLLGFFEPKRLIIFV
jgi:hypothetical protein